MQDHVEGYLELSAKTKIYFATAVSMWDAEFYIKVDDDIHVNIGKEILPWPFHAHDIFFCLPSLAVWSKIISQLCMRMITK